VFRALYMKFRGQNAGNKLQPKKLKLEKTYHGF
jgi:hypothetical protein